MKYETFRQSQTLASNAFIEAFSRLVRWTLRIGSCSEQLRALTSRKARRLSERKYIPNTINSKGNRERCIETERKKLEGKKHTIGDEGTPVSSLPREHSTRQVLRAHRYLSPTGNSAEHHGISWENLTGIATLSSLIRNIETL